VELNIRVKHGAIRAHRFGDPAGPLVLCVHGLSANARGFDPLAASLSSFGYRVVAIDLRGRGHSTTSPPGTYGWKRHALDVLAVAAELSPDRFHLIGHSMGAFIAMQACELAADRLRSVTLIDAIGFPEPASMPPILSAVERLGKTHPSAEAYLARVRSLGTIEPWSEHWERYFQYELVETRDGVEARTSHHAVLEDVFYASTRDPHELWPAIRCPSLLVRAARPLGSPGGYLVSSDDRDRFLKSVPSSVAVDVDANHYGVLMHPGTFAAVGRFLS
jgi:pimeloyl-ACP methyl ester carboxylesterase